MMVAGSPTEAKGNGFPSVEQSGLEHVMGYSPFAAIMADEAGPPREDLARARGRVGCGIGYPSDRSVVIS